MDIAYVKSLHIIFVICWFAGLFYIPRLFIYQTEANAKSEPERSILINQFRIMQKRLWYGITWPAGVLALVFGLWMYFANFATYLTLPWMHLKLFFVAGVIFYHLQCHIIFNQLKRDVYKFSSLKLRIFNELATLLLFAIVFLVVVKSNGGFVWGMLGLIVLSGLLFLGIFIYKKQRLKLEEEEQNKLNNPPPPPTV